MVITSYQLVVQDVKYFQRVKWQYMVLDEAQALKSSTRYINISITALQHYQMHCRLSVCENVLIDLIIMLILF